MNRVHRIGVVGTGFIARGFVLVAETHPGLTISKVLTRREIGSCAEFPRKDLLTNSVAEVIDHSDVILEASGDTIHATEVVDQVLKASLPVVTMDSEFQATAGSFFVNKGLLTEAEGDQPGCLAALRENCLQMGFNPLVYGNIKGFLNHTPTLEQMRFWSAKQGISLQQVTSFTDGTKIQIEQALVANAFGAGIAVSGLLGIHNDDLDVAGKMLADGAVGMGYAISDYVLSPNLPPGVFICATHTGEQSSYLKYLKLGDGPYYVILQGWHLCHLEIPKTILRVMNEGRILLNNSADPTVGVAAVAKKALAPGEKIKRGIGGFEVRGECVRIREVPDHIPIALVSDAVVRREVAPGQHLTFDDVEIADSLAVRAWLEIKERVVSGVKQKEA
jgi:predicted homoserine dehydrogenase-like protein